MMKKLLCIVLALAMVLSLCACKSKAVVEVEEAIDRIGDVTLDSSLLIEKAEEKYDALSREEKDKVENHDVLVRARREYDELLIEDVEEKIGRIDVIASDVRETYQVAKDAFDQLTQEQQEQVESRDYLEAVGKLLEVMITDYQYVNAEKANSLEEPLDMWYDQLDAAAACFVLFWLEIYDSVDGVEATDISLSPQIGIDRDDGRIDLYSTYGDNGIICIRYWPEAGEAELGTIDTSAGLDAYVELMVDCGIVDEAKAIPLSNISKVINIMTS